MKTVKGIMNSDTYSVIGDRYFQRRGPAMEEFAKTPYNDPIIWAVDSIKTSLKDLEDNVLEIGCSNGWRLNALRGLYGFHCFGIDPSGLAIMKGKELYPNIDLREGIAEELPYPGEQFDIVIFGFCLYACARENLFLISAQADRVLKTGGSLIVHDFYPSVNHHNINLDYPSVRTYKMDYSTMFSWHPAYKIMYRQVMVEPGNVAGDKVATVVFQKEKVE